MTITINEVSQAVEVPVGVLEDGFCTHQDEWAELVDCGYADPHQSDWVEVEQQCLVCRYCGHIGQAVEMDEDESDWYDDED